MSNTANPDARYEIYLVDIIWGSWLLADVTDDRCRASAVLAQAKAVTRHTPDIRARVVDTVVGGVVVL
jgi:hypothetical protein